VFQAGKVGKRVANFTYKSTIQDDMGVDDYRRKCGRDRGRAISYMHFAD